MPCRYDRLWWLRWESKLDLSEVLNFSGVTGSLMWVERSAFTGKKGKLVVLDPSAAITILQTLNYEQVYLVLEALESGITCSVS